MISQPDEIEAATRPRRAPVSTLDWDPREGRVAIFHAEARNEVRLVFQRGKGIGSWAEIVLSRDE